MGLSLDDDARQYLRAFADETGVTGQDCLVFDTADTADTDTNGRLLIVVSSGELGDAIGPGGRTVTRYEERVGKHVRLIEAAADPETFIANAFAPAAVYNVTISENDDTVAYVEVAADDHGIAIGTEGQTIEAVRTLADRHFGIDDVQLI